MNLNLNSKGQTTTENKEPKENKTQKESKPQREEMRKKMILVFGAIVGFILVILFILFIFSIFTNKKYSYIEIENIMKEAAIKYYSDHKGRLPQSNETVEAIDEDVLVRNEYMHPLSDYLKEGVNCFGKVEVDYNNGDYIYTPYLECGKAYATEELYKKVTQSKNLVVDGYGLYNINNEFVYRGENVNNYISLDGEKEEKSLWRIVKFTSNNEAVLIKEKTDSCAWDDRYNATTELRNGINDYSISRIKDELKKLYKLNDDQYGVLNKKSREKLVSFDQCIGKRAGDYTANDNSAECSVLEPNQKMGLLTLSDYLNASTDINCNSVYSKSCQNYNYLKTEYNWWLATALTEDTNSVYRVNNVGYIEKYSATNMIYIRPVVHLSSKAMYVSGNGTINNPYQFR